MVPVGRRRSSRRRRLIALPPPPPPPPRPSLPRRRSRPTRPQAPILAPGKPPPPPWTKLPQAVASHIIAFLPLESFALESEDVSRVCRAWHRAARQSWPRFRVTDANVRLIGRMCRAPFVESVDTDRLDATMTAVLVRLRHLRSLTWRTPVATAFDELPAIVRANPRLVALRGSRIDFSALAPSRVTRAVADTCRRLLAQRSERDGNAAARINDSTVGTCVCGNPRFTDLGRCHRSECPTFTPTPLVLEASCRTMLADDILWLREVTNVHSTAAMATAPAAAAAAAATRHRNLLGVVAARFLGRLDEHAAVLDNHDNELTLLRRQLAAAEISIKTLRAEAVELRGELADAIADRHARRQDCK